jgi:hypothetical protein
MSCIERPSQAWRCPTDARCSRVSDLRLAIQATDRPTSGHDLAYDKFVSLPSKSLSAGASCSSAKESSEDGVFGLAAQLAYYFFLALFPAVLFILAQRRSWEACWWLVSAICSFALGSPLSGCGN